jgi:transketolase
VRAQILNTLFERMAVDDRVFFLTGDMGINLVERFQQAYPTRYLNVGIAEQDLIGVSAGLAKLGYRPFAYTISNFLTHRCFEQIRNDVVLHDAPVTLLGTSAGFDNAPLGPTHHVIDDLGALKALHGIDLYTPSSARYATNLVERVLAAGRPAYVRMAKAELTEIDSVEDVVYERAERPRILLVSYGSPVRSCFTVHRSHHDVSLLVYNRIRPLDREFAAAAIAEHERTIVVEDHLAASGLYAELSIVCTERRLRAEVQALGPSGYTFVVGASPEFYSRMYRFDIAGIEEAVAV